MEILIFPLICAAIGFFTNILAILMLFRPHREIKVGRFVLPFTPGLIPKGRREIAKKVGEVLGEKLLTKDALALAVAGEGVTEKLVESLQGYVYRLFEDESSICEIASRVFLKPAHEIESVVSYKVNEYIDAAVKGALTEWIRDAGRGKTLGEILPDEIFAHVSELLRGRAGEAPRIVQEIISHPKWGVFLRQTVTKIIKDNVKGILGLLANPDKIYDTLSASLVGYLESADGQEAILENIGKLDEWARELEIDALPENARQWATHTLGTVAEHIKQSGVAEGVTKKLLNTPLKSLVPESAQIQVIKLIRHTIINLGLVEKAAGLVAGGVDIPRIVEEKINEMDVAEAEKILLSVAGKQLKWIAALGGVLGFIIGFVPSFF